MSTEKKTFTCQDCSATFEVAQAALDRYPGWTPKRCLSCKDKSSGRGKKAGTSKKKTARTGRKKTASATENLPLAKVLELYSGGPDTGLFTDGSSQPNPGPGGWGAVLVKDGEVVAQAHGHDPDTTNNRMELTALIEAFKLAPEGQSLTCYTDSDLCVKSMTQWAPGWRSKGWRRKGGPIKNLELVQKLFALVEANPNIELKWIQAHDGSRWNEYADALSTAWARDEL